MTATEPIEFYIDEETHYHQISENNVLYRVSLRNNSTDQIEDLTLYLDSVSPLEGDKDLEPGMYMEVARLKVLRNLPLLVMHDRDIPPKTLYALLPGESLSVDIVQYNASVGMFVLWHGKRRYNRRAADGLIEEVQHPDPFVPAMDYRLTVEARWWQGTLQEQVLTQFYEVGIDDEGKMFFREKDEVGG